MHVINARNVHEALPKMLQHLQSWGDKNESRYGNVIVAPMPVTTVYRIPMERVMFWKDRDINPFFHLFESFWMLAGRCDVAWLAYWNKRMAEFSEDGFSYHGAYGHRWRNHFNHDQLNVVVELLTNKPKSRRAIIQMFDTNVDLHPHENIKDIPCNTIIAVWRQYDALDMTVFCRSNDIIWGAAGTNAVHFAILQEYLAAKIGVDVGTLYQISNNFHAYEGVYEKTLPVVEEWRHNRYQPYYYQPGPKRKVDITPIITDAANFDSDLQTFMSRRWDDGTLWCNRFFPEIAVPMATAFSLFRDGTAPDRYEEIHRILMAAYDCCTICDDPDWLASAIDWMKRREAKEISKRAGAV